ELAGGERGERLLPEVQPVRRVGEKELESPAAGRHAPERSRPVATPPDGAGLDAERPDVLVERRDGARVALDEGGVRGAARERLEADAARAREQVEHARGRPAESER